MKCRRKVVSSARYDKSGYEREYVGRMAKQKCVKGQAENERSHRSDRKRRRKNGSRSSYRYVASHNRDTPVETSTPISTVPSMRPTPSNGS